jgi:diaminobutyrate-2-oxoglutarate transaminase
LCVLFEPLLSEGGDLYGTTRFFRALRWLTQAWGVPLVADETQTGFGLTGPFWAIDRLGLTDLDGHPDTVDVLTVAKRAQVGCAFGRLPCPHTGGTSTASLLRGAAHARFLTAGRAEADVEALATLLRDLLQQGARDLPPGMLANLRSAGGAVAFDVPEKAHADAVIAQRFWRRFLVYPCGDRTLRARLTPAMTRRDVLRLATRLVEALEQVARKDPVPAWLDLPEPPPPAPAPSMRLSEQVRRARRAGGAVRQAFEDALVTRCVEHDDRTLPEAMMRLLHGVPRPWPRGASQAREAERLRQALAEAPDRVCETLRAWGVLEGPVLLARTGIGRAWWVADALAARLETVTPATWPLVMDGIMAIEHAVYEPARQDTLEDLRDVVHADGGVALVALRREAGIDRVVGFCVGDPVENHRTRPGPDRDPHRGRHDTFYGFDLALHPDMHGTGLGDRLKESQIRAVARMRRRDGTPRYRYIVGRTRSGSKADRVLRMIQRRGGWVDMVLRGRDAYGPLDSVAIYYRLPLRRMVYGDAAVPVDGARPPSAADPAPLRASAERLARAGVTRADDDTRLPFVPDLARSAGPWLAAADHDEAGRPLAFVDLAASWHAPLGYNPPEVVEAVRAGRFDGAAVDKLNLSNFATRAYVHHVERMRRLAPEGLAHYHLTSSRCEAVDKAVKCLRYHRPRAAWVGSFAGASHGEVTAAARSLTWWPDGEAPARRHFDDWPYLPYPGRDGVGEDDAIEALSRIIEVRGGPERCAGVFVEPVQARDAYAASPEFHRRLRALTAALDVPLVVDETVTAFGRCGTRWGVERFGWERPADVVIQGFAGQLGGVWVSDRYYVSKPLQLISTWDGDEVSLLRADLWWDAVDAGRLWEHAARVGARVRERLAGMGFVAVRGVGLLIAADLADARARDVVVDAALRAGVLLGRAGERGVLIAPPVNLTRRQAEDAMDRLAEVVRASGA